MLGKNEKQTEIKQQVNYGIRYRKRFNNTKRWTTEEQVKNKYIKATTDGVCITNLMLKRVG